MGSRSCVRCPTGLMVFDRDLECAYWRCLICGKRLYLPAPAGQMKLL